MCEHSLIWKLASWNQKGKKKSSWNFLVWWKYSLSIKRGSKSETRSNFLDPKRLSSWTHQVIFRVCNSLCNRRKPKKLKLHVLMSPIRSIGKHTIPFNKYNLIYAFCSLLSHKCRERFSKNRSRKSRTNTTSAFLILVMILFISFTKEREKMPPAVRARRVARSCDINTMTPWRKKIV